VSSPWAFAFWYQRISEWQAKGKRCLQGFLTIRGGIQNIPDWCRRLYSSCDSAKHRSQQAKLRIPGSTATFCGDCVKTCEDVAPNFGENRPGCFTMTTPRLTLPSSPSSFWHNTKWLSSPTEIQAESPRQKRTSRKHSKKWRRWDRFQHAGGTYFEGDGGRQALWRVLWFLQLQSGIFWIDPRIQ
jgi:hypothetical protein